MKKYSGETVQVHPRSLSYKPVLLLSALFFECVQLLVGIILIETGTLMPVGIILIMISVVCCPLLLGLCWKR
jgi:hypothetical protein